MDFLLRLSDWTGLRWLFDPTGFPARWHCGSGWAETPWLGWLHIFSDLGVWTAYFAIPITLGYFMLRKKELPFRGIFFLFGAFILLCGLTHLMDATLFWWPVYRFAGMLKLVTALVSWGTVFALIFVTPQVLSMRGPDELQREIVARSSAESELQRVNAELEQRVNERTLELSKAVADLAAERELLRTTLRSIGDGVIITDMQGRVAFVNEVAEALTAWRAGDALEKPLPEVFHIVHEDTRLPMENPATQTLVEGSGIRRSIPTLLLAKDGEERVIDESAAPIRGVRGKTVGSVIVFRDITERRRANRILRESEARKTAMFETALDCIISLDHTGRILEFNAAAEQTFGYQRDEARGKDLAELIRTSGQPPLNQRLELTAVRAGGAEFPIEFTMTRIPLDGPPIFTAFLRDITQRREFEIELRKTAADLSRADRRKSEFLAVLAHELRNPLAPIRNALTMLRISDLDVAERQGVTAVMERQIGQMVRLVDDLLDVSRISEGKIELRPERVELRAIIEQAVETSRPLFETTQQELTVDLPPDPIWLQADAVRLAQVFSNLLNNACKYSERGGRIALSATANDGAATVSVKDSGVGIPNDMLPQIFEMFTQVDQSLERSQGGLGIGLTLVKRLVELHGGSVAANSDGPGRGSEFVVRLPVPHETAVPAPAVPPPVAKPAPVKRRILVVDDNRDAAVSLAMLLKITGNETHTAHDGLAAVEAAEAFRPDVIILDIGLPKLNGYDAARRIREQPWAQQTVLIALTGWGQEEDRRRSRESGFDHHLVKPVEHATLVELITELPR